MKSVILMLLLWTAIASAATPTTTPVPTFKPTPGIGYYQIRDAPISVIEQFGSDACVQFNAAVAKAYASNMHKIVWPPGVYPVTHTCLLPLPTGAQLISGQFTIEAAGVTLQPTGITKAFESNYAGNAVQVVIHGLRISVPDSTLLYGIRFAGAAGNACDGCEILLNTAAPNAALVGIYIGLRDLTDATTGSQQVDIVRSKVVSYLGTNLPIGIQVQGYSVGWAVRESAIYNADKPIDLKDVPSLADGLLPADGLIEHNDFQHASVASIVYETSTMAATNFGTVSIFTNNFEFAPYVLDMSGLPASPLFLAGPMLCGNTTHPDMANYINNPNAQPVRSNCSDIPNSAITPTVTAATPTFTATQSPTPVATPQHAGVGSVSILNCPVLTSNVDAGQTCPTSTATPTPTQTFTATPTQTGTPTATATATATAGPTPVPALTWWQNRGPGPAGTLFVATTANKLNYSVFFLDAPVSFNKILWWLNTADATAGHKYDLGIYNSSGTLLVDTGAIPLNITTGIQNTAFLVNAGCTGSGTPGACCTGSATGTCPVAPLMLPPGRYFWATTGDTGSVAIQDILGVSAGYFNYVSGVSFGSSASGILPATISPPAEGPTGVNAVIPDIGLGP